MIHRVTLPVIVCSILATATGSSSAEERTMLALDSVTGNLVTVAGESLQTETQTARSELADLVDRLANLERKFANANMKTQPPRLKLRLYHLKHRQAEAVAKILIPLFAADSDPATTITFDKRTNMVFARGVDANLSSVDAVVGRLDSPGIIPR